jgi:hypothetical protein
MLLNEDSLQAGDLRNLLSHIFEVDQYKSKMGDDKDVVVLSFTVESEHPADDLVDFVEKGYQFVLDADKSPGEMRNGKYKVFVEIERDKHISENIENLLYGVGKLAGIENFKFRYYKSFNSIEASKTNLEETIPSDPASYETTIQERQLENYDNFFSQSMLESLTVVDDVIEFKKVFAEPLKFKILESGKTKTVLESLTDKIAVDYYDMAEIMFLTKYIGNYNITKMGTKFMFEHRDHAVIMEKI